MHITAGVFRHDLIIVGRLQKARCPAKVAVGEQRLVGADLSVAVAVVEEIGESACGVADRCLRDLCGIALDRGVKALLQADDLGMNAARPIAIAVKIAMAGTDVADVLDATVTSHAVVRGDLCRMGIVAGHTGIGAGHMDEAADIALARIMEATAYISPVHYRRRNAVMHVEERKFGRNGILLDPTRGCRHVVARLAALMADRADRRRTKTIHRRAGWKPHAVQRMGRRRVTGGATDRRIDRCRTAHHKGGAAVSTQIVDETRLGMAGRTSLGDSALFIPVCERAGVIIAVRRRKPGFDEIVQADLGARGRRYEQRRCGNCDKTS